MGTIPRYLDFFDMDFFLIAMRYTLLEQDVLDSEFPRCAERGVGIVIGGTYNSGILATGAVPARDATITRRPSPKSWSASREMEAVCTAPRRAARRRGAAIPARPSDRRLGHSRRDFARAGRAEPRRVQPPYSGRPLGRTQARKTAARRRAGAGLIQRH